jgi:hypothetical protein
MRWRAGFWPQASRGQYQRRDEITQHFLDMYLFKKFIFSIPTRKYRTLLPSGKRSKEQFGRVVVLKYSWKRVLIERTAAEGTDLYSLDAVAGMNVEMLDDLDVEGGFGDVDGTSRIEGRSCN